jgi:type VI protein secretion system component Hcp
MTTQNGFCFRVVRACGMGLALSFGFSASIAAPIGAAAPATRAVGSVAAPSPGAAVTHTPSTLNADLVVDGNGVLIGGRFAKFGTTAGIVSTSMVPLTPIQRAKRVPQACHFTGSFTMKNIGGRGADGVDVDVWVDQPQGPQVGKIWSSGFGNPPLAPGASYSWYPAFDLQPGSYVYHLVVDRKHLNRQFAVNLVASCGFGEAPQMNAPALAPAQGAGGVAPAGGIGIARARPHAFMLVAGVPGESKDPGHQNWIDLLSVSWRETGAAGGAGGRCRPVSVSATKHMDKSSPQLANLAVSGTQKEVTIDGPDGRRTLQNASFSSVAAAGGALGDNLPRESVTLVGNYCP